MMDTTVRDRILKLVTEAYDLIEQPAVMLDEAYQQAAIELGAAQDPETATLLHHVGARLREMIETVDAALYHIE